MKGVVLYICIGCWLLSGLPVMQAATTGHYGFRVYLKDKAGSPYSTAEPEAFLSPESVRLRQLKNKPVTEADLPVSPTYIDALASEGVTPVATSKWMNTVVVITSDSTVARQLSHLPGVDSVKWVWKGVRDADTCERSPRENLAPTEPPLQEPYGYAGKQIRMHNGDKLHKKGFRGEGMRVAVIDAGFENVDQIAAFDSLRLIGTHNVVSPERTVFDDDEHGTKVLSCLAANAPGWMVGTAPNASYLLLKSEDRQSEYPIEEDYWVTAVEYADSVGVDVITSSLGYFEFDAEELSYSSGDLNGHTAFISRAASQVNDRGILLFCSAGNEGYGYWERITFPADVASLLTIGSVTDKKKRSSFSSFGPAADGRVKPDLVALGTGCCVIDENGDISYSNGTSFSTPILAGLGICLWQALPALTSREIMDLLRATSSQYKKPDTEVGYGLPDVYKAYKKGSRHGTKR